MLAVIGGSGLKVIDQFRVLREHQIDTPYGAVSAPIRELGMPGASLLFLSRHGDDRHLPPHAVNYRANIWALAELGVTDIITVNIVGGLSPSLGPGSWLVPDQLIDYTWGREHSFYDGRQVLTEHIDFDPPFDERLSLRLVQEAAAHGLAVQHRAIYGCTQGPRLETAAEIRRLAGDGCDVVGMTAMPEAALARERGIRYAALCLVVNWAAGIAAQGASLADMLAVVASEMPRAVPLMTGLADGGCQEPA